MKLYELDATQAHRKLVEGEITSVELTQACLERIKETNDTLNSFTQVFEKEALEQAKKADQMIADGKATYVTGIPFSAKEVILTEGEETNAASNMLKGYEAAYSATGYKKILDEGGVLLGHVNCDAFAHGASTLNSDFGVTKNPFDLDRVAGGSSGGSAAAVASGQCLYSLGTDTGGSIRHPAAFCNVVGLKPSYGRVSRSGLIAMTSSTDCLSVIARDVNDAAAVLSSIAGEDIKDSTTLRHPTQNYAKAIRQGVMEGATIGIPKEFFEQEIEPGVKELLEKAIKRFEQLGIQTKEISLPMALEGVAVYYIITPSELSANLQRFDGIRYGYSAQSDPEQEPKDLFEVYTKSRGKGLNAENKRRIMIGTHALSSGYYDAYYIKASKVRTLIIEEFTKAFKEVDYIFAPTTPSTAFKIEGENDPLKLYLEDIFLSATSLAGVPAISIPCGKVKPEDGDKEMPVGLQLIAPPFDEANLLRLAKGYEQASGFQNEIAISI